MLVAIQPSQAVPTETNNKWGRLWNLQRPHGHGITCIADCVQATYGTCNDHVRVQCIIHMYGHLGSGKLNWALQRGPSS